MGPFRLINNDVRRRAMDAVRVAPEGWVVRISEPAKTRDQENLYHDMIDDIAKQWRFMGERLDKESMKRLMVDAFDKAMKDAGTPLRQSGRIVPSIDGLRIVQLGIQTRGFNKREASEFIEFLSAWGAEKGIVWRREYQPEEA